MNINFFLKEAKKMGVHSVLITCDDDNIPSLKAIERNGGILRDKIDHDGNALLDVWMSHGDKVTVLPAGFKRIASSSNSPFPKYLTRLSLACGIVKYSKGLCIMSCQFFLHKENTRLIACNSFKTVATLTFSWNRLTL